MGNVKTDLRILVALLMLTVAVSVNADITIKVMKGGEAPYLYAYNESGTPVSDGWPGTQYSEKDNWHDDLGFIATKNSIGKTNTDMLDYAATMGSIFFNSTTHEPTISRPGNKSIFVSNRSTKYSQNHQKRYH